jgi:DNA-binding response OmpR family regulator
MKILIVEDDQKIAEAVKRGLSRKGFAVDIAFDTDEARSFADQFQYDLIILDRMLPGFADGVGFLKHLRAENNHTRVLFLTAKDKVLDRTEGLNAGADDYLVKPFSFIELLARVNALLRRPNDTYTDDVLTLGTLQLDPINKVVTRAGSEITLTAKEFMLLEHFMRHQGIIMSKERIVEQLWDFDSDVLPSTVEVYVKYLRNKIETPFANEPKLLHTKRGFGYVLKDDS